MADEIITKSMTSNTKTTDSGERENKGFEGTDDEKIEVKGQRDVNDISIDLSPEEEEQILEKLREVVRKCTHVDPNKRPTAAEVQKLLEMPDVKKL